MDKKKLWLLIGGFVAVVLVCAVLVGLLNGFWPWNGGNSAETDGAGVQTEEQTGDTDGSEDTTLPGTTGSVEVTDPEGSDSTDPTKETSGKNNGGNSGTGNNGTGNNGTGDGDIDVDISDETESTDVSIGVEEDDTEPATRPVEGEFEIDFDDLLGSK